MSEVGNIPNSANSTDPCFLGDRARDIFTKELYCPIFASQSLLGFSFAWYGLFLITGVFAWLMGMSIDATANSPATRSLNRAGEVKDPPDPRAPIALVRFLDCSRAKYDGWHLLAYFVTITLCLFCLEYCLGNRLTSGIAYDRIILFLCPIGPNPQDPARCFVFAVWSKYLSFISGSDAWWVFYCASR